MILAQSGESYPINRNGVDATVSKSVDDIMAYVTALGYNSFLLVNATYTFSTEFYVILPFDATLVNGDSIYLLDNPTGISEDPTTGARADRVRNHKYNVNNDGNIQQAGSISWSMGTYYGANYRTYPYKTYEPIFYTTLEYSHIYVNNEDVTPVLYAWSSVPAISGKNGILRLSTLVDINDGNPVETTDTTKFTLTSASNIKTLVDAVPLGSIPASGGGASGGNPQYGGQTITGKSGTQESGYAFGQGGASGGGGGFYGGYGAEDDVSPAGAGSGYIGNPLLSNKKMYGYGVSKVTTEDAYTVSKTDHSSAAIEKRPKAGNGHARITYLRPSEHPAPVWDGHFFNADFSSDGRDSVRYDSSRTVVFPLDNSDMEPHTAIQGTMFEGFNDTEWSISNGILDTGNAEYDGKNFIWLYDYEHIDNKILPRSCTFYIDMDFWIYDDDYRSMHLSFHSPYTYYDVYGHLNLIEYMTFGLSFSDYYTPHITTQILDSTGEGYNLDYDIGSSPLPITYQTWHNLKAKVEILSSRVSKITLYFDNVEFASKEFDAATEQVPFVCINDNDTRPAWFCMLSGGGFKTRKVFVGRSVT